VLGVSLVLPNFHIMSLRSFSFVGLLLLLALASARAIEPRTFSVVSYNV